MTPEFRADMRRAMKQFQDQGFECRFPTPKEIAAEKLAAHRERQEYAKERRLKGVGKGRYKGCRAGAKPFEDRVKDMKKVREIAADRGITIRDACDVVGISFSNYRSVKAAYSKGLTKR